MKFIFISFLFFTLNINLLSQQPVLKKKTSIKKYYYYTTPKPSIDTFIEKFTPEGVPTPIPKYYVSIDESKISRLDSTRSHQLSNSILLTKRFWSDSSIDSILCETSEKSINILSINNHDTVYIRKALFLKKKQKNFDFRVFEEILANEVYFPYYLRLSFEDKHKIKCEVRYQNGKVDSFKITSLNPQKTYEIEAYNLEKKEWYVKEKVIKKKRKKVIWQTFFHDYHKQYFTTNRIVNFNKYKQEIKEVEYDDYGILKAEELYFYEYYK